MLGYGILIYTTLSRDDLHPSDNISVKTEGNTVGSPSKTELAYIAGFLDGDGSLMFQLKRRKDSRRQFRYMFTVCLYQDTRHEETLHWMRDVLEIGYISRRNDGISELRVNGYAQIMNLMKMLTPYVRFKKKQCDAMLKAAQLLLDTKWKTRSDKQVIELIDYMVAIQNENYVTKSKRTKEEFMHILGVTP